MKIRPTFLPLMLLLFWGACSQPISPPPAPVLPADVSEVSFVPGDGRVDMFWTDPDSASFQKVIVTSSGMVSVEVLKGIQVAELTGLANGTARSFLLQAEDGKGQRSSGVSVVVTPAAPIVTPGTQLTSTFGLVTKIAPDAAGTWATDQTDWYKDQVFYHVWLKAFRDSNANGIGDIAGVTEKLDYLKDLGVTAIWLSPFFKTASSTSNLHGYDVTDHYAVDPRFGTLDDVKTLLQAAHANGLRVIFDFVPNHVSNQHPWFLESRAGLNGKRPWFIWRNSRPTQGWADLGGGGPGSGFHQASNGKSYYGIFWDGMPDLNYRNPEVRQAMADVVVHWLNLGFDGMRVDAVKYLYEDAVTGANADQTETIRFFQALRSEILDGYAAAGASKFMVAENWTSDASNLRRYLKDAGKNGFEATLDFPLGYGITSILNDAASPGSVLGDSYSGFVAPAEADGGWTFSFLSNHDNYQSRPRTLFGSVQKMRVAQALQMAAWGTPVLYYGNEIGMLGSVGNDTALRTSFDWTLAAAAQAAADSNYSWQKTLDQLRADRMSWRRGTFQILPSSSGTLALVRTHGAESTLMVANFSAATLATASVDLSGVAVAGLSVLVGSAGQTMAGSSLTLTSIPPYGVRIFALESNSLPALRGDFSDGAPPLPPTKVWAGAKDGSTAVLAVSFYDQTQQLLGTLTPTYTGNGGSWWASMDYEGSLTDGYVRWTKASEGYDSGLLSFHITGPGGDWILGYPHWNTGSSSTWFLRGIGGDWNHGIGMVPVEGEAGHWVSKLDKAQAPSSGVAFKINASATAWDYFFGFRDVLYATDKGDPPGDLVFAPSGTDLNFSFVPTGTDTYEVHFLLKKGPCEVWIKKVGP